MSYSLWIARDFTVVGSSFVLPPIVARAIQENNILPSLSSEQTLRLAQIVSPAAAQFIAGPLHFVGLDWFNRPSLTISLAERAVFLKKAFAEVVSARIARIMPGYGLAGVWNHDLRTSWRQRVMNHSEANAHNHQWWQIDALSLLSLSAYTKAKSIANRVGMGILSSSLPKPPQEVLATTSTDNGDDR
jgi:hypothetical protein